MNSLFNKYIERQIEKHLPTTFIDFGLLVKIVDVLSKNKKFERREILILSYVIGLNAEEGNVLLSLAGEQPLYVKHREDAVWRYALNNRKDCNSIIREIFPENTDENHKSNLYNKVTVKRKEQNDMPIELELDVSGLED